MASSREATAESPASEKIGWDKSSAWSKASRSDATSARSSASSPHASLTKAERREASHSIASPTICLIFCHCSGFAAMTFSLQLAGQPGLRHIPIPLYRRFGNAQFSRNFLKLKAAKETHFHQPALLLVELCQPLQRFIQGKNIGALDLVQNQ